VDDTRLGRFVKRRLNSLQSFGCFLLFAGAENLQITSLLCVKARFDAAILLLLARAAAHPAFGRFGIGHSESIR